MSDRNVPEASSGNLRIRSEDGEHSGDSGGVEGFDDSGGTGDRGTGVGRVHLPVRSESVGSGSAGKKQPKQSKEYFRQYRLKRKLKQGKTLSPEDLAFVQARSAAKHAVKDDAPDVEVLERRAPMDVDRDEAGRFLSATLGAGARVANGLSRKAGLGVEVPESYDGASGVLGPMAEHSPRAVVAAVTVALGMTVGLAGWALVSMGRKAKVPGAVPVDAQRPVADRPVKAIAKVATPAPSAASPLDGWMR